MKRFYLSALLIWLCGCIPVGAWFGLSEATKDKGKGTVILSPPVVSGITVQDSAGNDPVEIIYKLLDSASSAVGVTVEYSTDGGTTWALASVSGGDGLTGLTSSPTGEAHTFETRKLRGL